VKKFLLAVVISAFLMACGGPKKESKVVQLKGSDTILNVSQAVAEEFMKQNKGARVAVTGGGSGTGIAGKLNKTVDVAMASRQMKDKELDQAKEEGLDIQEITIGFDGITVIVNSENPVANLSKDQLRDIFMGKTTNWKELGGNDEKIVVLSRDSSSGTHAYFKEDVLRKGDSKGTEEYGEGTLYLPSNEALKQEIKSSKGAIAYIGMGYMDDTVKSVSVDGIAATPENVANKTYPIARGVYWYTDTNLEGTVKELVEFMLSDSGQAIVAKEGFVPVK
jgi:phosphate transport system substrate-binding protein